MTDDEADAFDAAADDFAGVYELMLRIAQPGDDPLALANSCWHSYLALREHLIKHHERPTAKNQVN